MRRIPERNNAILHQAVSSQPTWISDRRFAWLTESMMYAMFFYVAVPWTILSGDVGQAAYTEPNPLYRTLKVLLLLISGLVVVVWRRSLVARLMREFNACFIAFFALAVMSAIWSIEPAITFNRCVSLGLIWLVCLASVAVGWQEQRFAQVVRRFFLALCVGSLLFGVISPDLAKEHGTGISLEGAWHGLLVQKNGLGHAASIGILFWTHSWLTRETKFWRFAVALAATLACLILSHSSTSMFATIFSVGLLLLLLNGPKRQRRSMVLVVFIFVIAILLYSLAVLDIVPGLDAILQPLVSITGKDMTFSGRTEIWDVIKEHISQHPLLGTGFGAYWIGPIPSSPSYVFITRQSNFYPSAAHNGYLDVINDLGYVGLIVLLGYLLVFLRQALALLKVDYVAATLYLTLLCEELIVNLSESDWLTPGSFSSAVMLAATCALARGALSSRWRADAQAQVLRASNTRPPLGLAGASRRWRWGDR